MTSRATPAATPDAAPSWVDRLPARLQPYARLARFDRPIGTWLLFWPCAWGVLLAGEPVRDAYLLPLFFVGALAMRSAGCVYNDIVDRDLDARVARTRSRPLASGSVSVKGAWIFLAALAFVGLIVLLQLDIFAGLIALASLLLVAAYPFMKRITWWPQAWLGLTFNWGALVGYAAATGTLSAAAALLYAAGIFWTLGYDTIYALQDQEDDALAGIKSSALRLGRNVRTGIAAFYALAAAAAALAVLLASASPIAALAAALPFALHLGWQLHRLRPGDAGDAHEGALALRLFRSNAAAGLLLAVGLAAAAALGL